MPLLNRGVFRGWIVLTFQTAGSLPPEDEPFAAALANQAVFALEITRVAKEASQAAVWRERDDAAEKRAAALADANGFLRDAIANLHTLEHLNIFLLKILAAAGSGIRGHDGTGWPPQVHSDIATSSLFDGAEDIRACFLAGGVRATMVVPVLAGNRHLGSFAVCASVARTWTAEQIELAQSLGNQAALAIEVKRLNDDTRKAAVEGERNRFARDIHDTLAQDFTAIAAHLRSARRKLTATRLRPADIASITAALDVAFETAQDGLLQARRSVWALTPRALEDGVGLANAIREVIGRMPAGRVEIMERGTPQSLPAGVGVELLSIAREAANNAFRHAGSAAKVIVSVSHEQQGVRLNIDDDGCGFNPKPAGGQQQGHFGLWTMRERASRIGGHFHLVSRPGCGTKITVFVPLGSER